MFRLRALRAASLTNVLPRAAVRPTGFRFMGSASEHPQFDVNARQGFLPKEVSIRKDFGAVYNSLLM